MIFFGLLGFRKLSILVFQSSGNIYVADKNNLAENASHQQFGMLLKVNVIRNEFKKII